MYVVLLIRTRMWIMDHDRGDDESLISISARGLLERKEQRM
jgi:hypothetical protein